MKKLTNFSIILAILVVSFISAQPVAAANTSITAQIVDGKTAQGWAYGAEIIVVQITGTNVGLKGSARLDANGYFTINYPTGTNSGMTDALGLCGTNPGQMGDCTPVNNWSSLQLLISFTCDWEPTFYRQDYQNSTDGFCPVSVDLNGNPVPLVGLPGNFEVSYTDTFSAVPRNLGNIDTNRGPTALELVDFSVTPQSSNNTWLPFVLLIGSVALVSGAVTIIRKRRA
jgi:hypothetical protein